MEGQEPNMENEELEPQEGLEMPDELEQQMPSEEMMDSGEMEDSPSMSNGYSPSNNFRKNQNQYRGGQYYKDNLSKTNDALDEARQKRDAARAEKNNNQKQVRDLDSNGNANWKDGQAPSHRTWENGKETTKGAPTKTVDKTKEDKKQDKKNLKEANKEYRQAKRDNRAAKFDRANNMANNILHPVEAGKSALKNKAMNPINKVKEGAKEKAKEGAKQAGKAAAKGVKKAGGAAVKSLTKLIVKLPPPVLIGAVVVIFIFLLIMLILGAEVSAEDDGVSGLGGVGCNYSSVSNIDSDTRVKIYSCDDAEGEIANVSLEKYIGGVALFALGKDYNPEVLKAYMIVLRTQLLAKASEDNDEFKLDNASIIIKDCNKNLKYWDYTEDLYVSTDGTNTYSYDQLEGYELYREALNDNEKTLFETEAKSVSCKYLTNDSGNIISPSITQSIVNNMISQATENAGTENGGYNALLLQNFSDATTVSSGESINASYFSGDIGEYSTWKQLCSLGSPWCSVCMADNCPCSGGKCSGRINEIGCAVTSISMLIAHSGLSTGTITDFNPGTFTKALKAAGGLGSGGGISWGSVKKVVPGFEFVGRVNSNGDISVVKDYADKGYYLVMEVKTHSNKENKQHYVAVNNAASSAAGWTDVYIWDPAQNVNKMSEKTRGYSYRANRLLVYKVQK